jgi:hypothetical protein
VGFNARWDSMRGACEAVMRRKGEAKDKRKGGRKRAKRHPKTTCPSHVRIGKCRHVGRGGPSSRGASSAAASSAAPSQAVSPARRSHDDAEVTREGGGRTCLELLCAPSLLAARHLRREKGEVRIVRKT